MLSARVLVRASVIAGSVAPVLAQTIKLNDPLARRPLATVQAFVLGPDGTRAVFLTGHNLFSVPADGSAGPTPIANATLAPADIRITPEGTRVVYLLSNTRAQRLFTAPLDASQSPQILNGALVEGGNVIRYELAATGGRVVYLADQETDGTFELFACATDGSTAPVKLSGPMVAGGDAQNSFHITPDGRTVVYLADQDTDEVFDLYGVPIDGSAPPVCLNLTRPNADVQDDFALAWDSRGVVYRADQDADDVFELYAARVDGSGSSVKRSAPLVAGGDVLSFRLSGVNDRLLYRADQEVNERVELYSTHALAGGTPVKLNGALVANGDVNEMQLGADGAVVVYRADQLTDDIDELFGVPADGSSTAVRLSAPVAGFVASSYQLPAASGRVLYTLAAFGASSQLFSAPLDGSQPPKRLDESRLADGLGCVVQDVLADGTVLFTADVEAIDHRELFRVPLDASAPPRRLSANLVSGGRVAAAHAAGAAADVVYLAEQDHSDAQELFSVPISGGRVRRLSNPLPLGEVSGSIDLFQCSADGRRVIYSARENSADVYDVYGVSSDGSGHSAQLNRPFSSFDTFLSEFHPSPDGTRVAFRLGHDNLFSIELHGAPSDIARASVRLDEPSDFVSGFYQQVLQFAFTPDSTRIVYLADQDRNDVFELFVGPSDGSQPAARLSIRRSARCRPSNASPSARTAPGSSTSRARQPVTSSTACRSTATSRPRD